MIKAGRAIGSTTDQNVRNVLAPSILAASSTLIGIDSKNCFMMNTPAASASSGTTRADGELYIPSWLSTRNFGISRTTPGTAITARIAVNSAARPLNLILASAYPASESKNTRPSVTLTATHVEFTNHNGKSVEASRSNAARLNGSGTRLSGFCVASALVLKLVTSWMRKGYK